MQEEQLDLGHKRTCPCGIVKYYDFYQDVINCPECGKSIEAVNIAKPKRGRKAGISVATPTKTAKENDELKKDLSNFLKDRFRYYLKEKDIRFDIIEASISNFSTNKLFSSFEKARCVNKIINNQIK